MPEVRFSRLKTFPELAPLNRAEAIALIDERIALALQKQAAHPAFTADSAALDDPACQSQYATPMNAPATH
jgi:hypothetical protein